MNEQEIITVTLLDTITGETREVGGISDFDWAENNWSCDCNRRGHFGIEDEGEVGICEGSHRFLVIKCSSHQRYSLRELNADYPDELLDKHLPKMEPRQQVIDLANRVRTEGSSKSPEERQELESAFQERTTIVALEDEFQTALIGNTLSPLEMPRFVYSLTALARLMSRKFNKSIEHAAEDVRDLVSSVALQHGNRAPLFVDDTPEEKSRIIVPGGMRR